MLRKRSKRNIENDMEINHEDGWVKERLAALEPQWNPDFARGRQL